MIAKNIVDWLREQKQSSDSTLIGGMLRMVFGLYHFHPKERFLNRFELARNIRNGRWKLMSFEGGITQRVFFICVEDRSSGKVVVKLPRADNQFSCALIAAMKDPDIFDTYKKTLSAIPQDPFLKKHSVEVLEYLDDGGYVSEYVNGFNLAVLRNELFDPKVFPEQYRNALIVAIDELLDNLQGYLDEHGKLIGDWPLHNLVFSPQSASIINVDSEGFFTFDGNGVENDISLIRDGMGDIAEFLKLLESESEKNSQIVAAFKVLDEVRRSGEAYSGYGFLVGYHSIEMGGRVYRGQRDCRERLARVPFNFKGKVVVDMGCNSGGMLHELSSTIQKGYGFDFNPKCVNAAHTVKVLNKRVNLEFFNFDLDRDELSSIPWLLLYDKVDICFLLSVCMWLERWRVVVRHAAALAENLLFESNGTVEQQEDQVTLLRTYFDQVTLISDRSSDDPLQGLRKLYLCSKRNDKAIREGVLY